MHPKNTPIVLILTLLLAACHILPTHAQQTVALDEAKLTGRWWLTFHAEPYVILEFADGIAYLYNTCTTIVTDYQIQHGQLKTSPIYATRSCSFNNEHIDQLAIGLLQGDIHIEPSPDNPAHPYIMVIHANNRTYRLTYKPIPERPKPI